MKELQITQVANGYMVSPGPDPRYGGMSRNGDIWVFSTVQALQDALPRLLANNKVADEANG